MHEGRRNGALFVFVFNVDLKEVAGRERCHEEATRIAPDRPNPTDSGDAADLSIP